MHLWELFFTVLFGVSLLLRSALWHESRGPWLCEHGVPPSRDVRPHDAWPLPRGGERHASDVLMLSCGAPQLSSTSPLGNLVG